MTPPAITGLLAALVKTAVLEPPRALELLEKSRSTKEPLLQTLMANGVSAIKIARAASQNFGLPQIDLDSFDTSDLPINLVPAKLLESGNALPLRKRGRRLTVAMADPSDLGILENFRFSTNLTIDVVVAEASKIARLLEEAANNAMAGMADLDDDLANIQIEGENFATDEKSDDPLQDDIVVKFVTKVLTDAIRRKASDIHIEPYEKQFRIRVRIDGILTEVPQPPRQLADRIVSRIKVTSRMDISERRIPQDGRIKLKLSAGRSIDFRVNSCPTLFGEKIVLRILDPTSAQLGIDSLGYEEDQKQLYLKALNRPYGMILITGPTGSGKTVSVYTGLNVLNTMDRYISTSEDPAEIVVPGINQVNVNAKVGLTFAAALRAFLRQDPDVIMVGEIRDLETAEIAIKAAQPGHLVLSTLHTNDAPQTLTRLMNMGVPGYNIASSVNLIIAQRLARRLCNSCKKVDHIPDEELLREGFNPIDVQSGMKIFKAVGCDQCTNGYKGRMGIYQVMPVSEEMGRIIMRGGNAIELAEQATKEGINDLRQSGIRKVKAGITSLEELNRVTKD